MSNRYLLNQCQDMSQILNCFELLDPSQSVAYQRISVLKRLEALAVIRENVLAEIRRHMYYQILSVNESSDRLSHLPSECSELRVCVSTCRSAMHNILGIYVDLLEQILILRRRRTRLTDLLGKVDKLAGISQGFKFKNENFVAVLEKVGVLLMSLPKSMVVIHDVQAKIGEMRRRFRAHVTRGLVFAASAKRSPPSSFLSEAFRQDYLSSGNSKFITESVFSNLEEWEYHEVVETFVSILVNDGILHDLMGSEPFKQEEYDCGRTVLSSKRFLVFLDNIRLSFEETDAPSKLLDSFITRSGEAYLILIFMSLSEVDFALILSAALPERDELTAAHETVLRRGKLPRIMSLLTTSPWNQYLDQLNRIRPRGNLGLSSLCSVVESARSFCQGDLFDQLSFSVFSSLISCSLAHPFSRWRENIIEPGLHDANKYLCEDLGSFLAAIRYGGGHGVSDFTLSIIGAIMEEQIVEKILAFLPMFAAEEVYDLPVILEIIQDLHSFLPEIMKADKSRWSVLYEAFQLLYLRDGPLMFSWCAEKLSEIPLHVLIGFLMFCEEEEVKRIQLIEQLEDLAVGQVIQFYGKNRVK
jgi:hypothetical protein